MIVIEDKLPKLTVRQRAFVENLAVGMTQSSAYRAAFDTENSKPCRVWEKSSRLVNSPKIKM